IDPRRLPWGRWEGLAGVGHQLFTGLVQAHLRAPRIVGTCVHFQHILHGTDKRGVGLRRDHPRLVLPRFARVFWSVVRTHSALIGSTMSRATALSAKSLKVHWVLPSRGELLA